MNDFRSMQDMFNGTVNAPVNRQPIPLFLADALNADARSPEIKFQAASELRRLYGLCIQLEEQLNAKAQRTWVNMTADEVDQGLLKTNYVMKTAEAWRHGVEWAQFNLMRKNT